MTEVRPRRRPGRPDARRRRPGRAARPGRAVGQPRFQATTLNLAADGETPVAPDLAVVSLGVQTHAPTAAEALRQNAEQMTAVFAVLRSAGIAERDVRTSSLNLAPNTPTPTISRPHSPAIRQQRGLVNVNDLARLGRGRRGDRRRAPTRSAASASG